MKRAAVLLVMAGLACLRPVATAEKPEGIVQMEKLQALVGTWSYTETYEKSAAAPEGAVETGVYEARLGPGGFSLIVDFTTHAKTHDEIGHGIITWDAKEKAYKEYIVGNGFPGCFVLTGHFENDHLVFQSDGGAGGTGPVMKTVYTEWKPNSMTIEQYFRMGDKPFQLMMTTRATKP